MSYEITQAQEEIARIDMMNYLYSAPEFDEECHCCELINYKCTNCKNLEETE